jgi:uncharacterized membrane protein
VRFFISENSVFFLAVGIGIVAGLRALTAPAAVSWGARLGWLNPHDCLLSFMGVGSGGHIILALYLCGQLSDLKRKSIEPMVLRECGKDLNWRFR